MEQLRFLSTYTDVYRARINGRWIYFESLPIPTHLTQAAYGWLDDKVAFNEFLRTNDIPTPSAYSVTSEAAALRAFEKSGSRVALKPRAGTRGRHTTTDVRTPQQLRQAFKRAQKLCRYVYVSVHLDGSVCRGTLVEGKLVGFFQADPPRLRGDGRSSISQLIAHANVAKHERVENIVLTEEHEAFMARQGYARDSVLEAGKRIALTHRTGRLFGGETRELLESVHPHLRKYLERAARSLDVPVVGFDLIIENPEADPDTQKWGIIEANSLPFIDLHYLPLRGTPSNVASAVWDLWPETKDPASAGPYATSLTSFSKTVG